MDELDLAELRQLKASTTRKNVQRILEEKIIQIESSIKAREDMEKKKLQEIIARDGEQEDEDSQAKNLIRVKKDVSRSEEIRKFTWSQTEGAVE